MNKIFLAVLLLLAAACHKSPPAPPSKPAMDSAKVMVLLTSPYLPALDMYLVNRDTFKLNTGPLAYPGVRRYVSVPAGLQWLYIYLAGTYSGMHTLQPYNLLSGGSYTVLNPYDYGSLNIVQDDLSAPPEGYARVRVIQGATYGGTLNVIASSGDTLAKRMNYKDVTAFMSIRAGNYTFDVKDGASLYVFRTSLQATLKAGKTYTLLGKTIAVADTSRIVVGLDLINNN